MSAHRARRLGRQLSVKQDDDGGATIHDLRSGLVFSIIGTHPDANGPRTTFVEVYPYESNKAVDWVKVEPTVSPLKPVFNFWTQDRPPVTAAQESAHEKHVDLRKGCPLCEFEAGNQRDRLTDPDDEVPT